MQGARNIDNINKKILFFVFVLITFSNPQESRDLLGPKFGALTSMANYLGDFGIKRIHDGFLKLESGQDLKFELKNFKIC